jgi:selenocysteine lyase/cysteine desulfurase
MGRIRIKLIKGVHRMRIIVVGGRDILQKNYEYIKTELDNVVNQLKSEGHTNFEIVHGELTYVEKMAKTYAEEKGYKHKKFIANIRNLDVKPCKVALDKYKRPYNTLANIYKNEKALYDYAISHMAKIPGMKFYSDPYRKDTIGVIPFNLEGVHHHLMTAILSDEAGVSVRNGFFCTHPYCERLLGFNKEDMNHFLEDDEVLFPGMVRISFGFYNNFSEIDKLIRLLRMIAKNKDYYINKYSNDLSSKDNRNEARLCSDSHNKGC